MRDNIGVFASPKPMLPLDAPASAADRRPPAVAFGPFTFDRSSQLLRRGEVEIPLPPRVLGVLDELIARAGEVVPRQALIDSVWREAFVTDTSLAEAVSFLRQALGDDPQAPQFVQTVHRRGYRFVAPVTELASAAQPGVRAAAGPEAGAAEIVSPSIGRQLVPWSLAAMSLVLAMAAVWQMVRSRPTESAVVRVSISPGPGTVFDPRGAALAISPDGTTLAWSGCDGQGCRLYVRPLDRLEPAAVPDTADASAPFFSPDGRWVGFFAGGALRKVTVAGASPVTIADAPQALGAAWLADGRIVFAPSARSGLLVVSEHGGPIAALTSPSVGNGEIGHAWPAALPGGNSILFSIAMSPAGSPTRIAILTPGSGRTASSWRTLVDNAAVGRPAGRDYLVYSRGTEILAMPFDAVRLTPAGVEQAVVSGVVPAQFAVSANGTLFCASRPDAPPRTTSWVQQGVSTPLPGEAATLRSAALSPDGRSVAGIGGANGVGSDVWIAETARGAATRLTHRGLNAQPVWSADGRTIYYSTSDNGPFAIMARDVTGAGAEARSVLTRGDRHLFPTSVRAGRLAFVEAGGPSRGDIWVASASGESPTALVTTPFDEVAGVLSPDATLLAYQSDASGRWEIYLLRLADRHNVLLSAGGGVAPFWASDGRAVFFTAGDRLVRVEVSAAGDGAGAASEVARLSGGIASGFEAGGRVLVTAPPMAAAQGVVTVQWIRELRRALGPPAAALPR